MKPNITNRAQNEPSPRRITTAVAIRLTCIILLWLMLVWIVVNGRPLTAWTLFVIAASGIVVFVPLYKKYVRDTKK